MALPSFSASRSMRPRRTSLTWLILLALAGPAAAAPDEDVLGKAQGYPIGSPRDWFYNEYVRVGSFSNLDRILPHYTLDKSASPLPLAKTASVPDIKYRFEGRT